MHVLTLRQPWAWLVVCGLKRVETRSWGTQVRKPIAIHASSTFTDEERALCYTEPLASALASTGMNVDADLPLGLLLGRVNLEDVIKMGTFQFPLGTGIANRWLSPRERAFGKYAPGRWAWILTNPVCYEPHQRVALRGMPGLWRLPGDVLLGRAPQPEDAP